MLGIQPFTVLEKVKSVTIRNISGKPFVANDVVDSCRPRGVGLQASCSCAEHSNTRKGRGTQSAAFNTVCTASEVHENVFVKTSFISTFNKRFRSTDATEHLITQGPGANWNKSCRLKNQAGPPRIVIGPLQLEPSTTHRKTQYRSGE